MARNVSVYKELVALAIALVSSTSLAASKERFDYFFKPATCSQTAGPSGAGFSNREIRGTDVFSAGHSMYLLSCESKTQGVVCTMAPTPGDCLKSSTFAYSSSNGQAELTEVYNNCVNAPNMNGAHQFSCKVEIQTPEDRATKALNEAACSGSESEVNFYLNFRDVKIDFVNPDTGKSTLGCAFESGSATVVKALLGNSFVSANPYLSDRAGKLPIESAKSPDQLEVLKELVVDFDINRPNSSGRNCLSTFPAGSALAMKVMQLWPNAKPIQLPPGDHCFEVSGSTITGFTCKHDEIVIPETIDGVTITGIGDYVFARVDSGGQPFFPAKPYFTKIVLPKKLVNIGAGAFREAGFLRDFQIPEGVTRIGDSAFQGNRFSEIALPSSLESIGRAAFAGNSLWKLVIPDRVIEVGNSAFSGNRLSTLVMPNSLDTIGDYAFASNNLERVDIPLGVSRIGEGAFESNPLREISVSDTVLEIGESAFGLRKPDATGTTLRLQLGRNVQKIGKDAFKADFYYCFNRQLDCKIENVVIPESVREIGEDAFRYNRLSSVTFAEGLVSIGMYAFAGNYLTSLEIPRSVQDISLGAFKHNNLTTVKIPAGTQLFESFDPGVDIVRY